MKVVCINTDNSGICCLYIKFFQLFKKADEVYCTQIANLVVHTLNWLFQHNMDPIFLNAAGNICAACHMFGETSSYLRVFLTYKQVH